MLRAVGKARFFGQSNFMKTNTTRSALWEKLDFASGVISSKLVLHAPRLPSPNFLTSMAASLVGTLMRPMFLVVCRS